MNCRRNSLGLLAPVFVLVVFGSASAQDPNRRMVLHLANCYFNLKQYDQAAQLYAQVPEPRCLNNQKLTHGESLEVLEYWQAQVQYAKALRLNKDFGKAKLVLDRVLEHPHGHFSGRGTEREQIYLLEDQGLWEQALKRWLNILQEPRIK